MKYLVTLVLEVDEDIVNTRKWDWEALIGETVLEVAASKRSE